MLVELFCFEEEAHEGYWNGQSSICPVLTSIEKLLKVDMVYSHLRVPFEGLMDKSIKIGRVIGGLIASFPC